jgi:hypothetical protein
MEDSNLNDVFNEPAQEPVVEQPQAAPEQPEPQETGEQKATPATEEDPIERRIRGLEAAAAAEQHKRQQMEAAYRQLQEKQQAPQAVKGEPDPNDYQDNPQAYWADLAEFKANQAFDKRLTALQEQQQRQHQEQQHQEVQKRLDSVVYRGQAKSQDFDAGINNGLAPFLSQPMREAIGESDVGDDVAYFLGKNPAEAARIAGLTERQMVRELTKLEGKLTAPKAPSIPQTLTTARDSRGQFQPRYDGPTPLDAIFARK